jgi:hypothetical protein
VAFAAIQGLNAEMNERTMKLQAENDALPRQVAAQKAQFDALEARLKKLEQAAPVRRKTKRRKKMTKSFYQPVVFAAFLLSLIVAVVNAQSIEQSVIASGGTSEGGNSTFSVTGIVGQPIAESSSGAPYAVRSGFITAAPLVPTAATVTVSGKVTTASGRGIRNVVVVMTDASGTVRRTNTTTFGYFRFTDVMPGGTYIFSARAKRFTFNQATQVRSVAEEISDINFVADESNL